MKKGISFLLAFSLLLFSSFCFAGDAELHTLLSTLYPTMQVQQLEIWGNTAAALLMQPQGLCLCVLENIGGTWQPTVVNSGVFLPGMSAPALLLDSDTALYWRYTLGQTTVTFVSMKEGNSFGNVSQIYQSPTQNGNLEEISVYYEEGSIVCLRQLRDENDNLLSSSRDAYPAPWLEDRMQLENFCIADFPLYLPDEDAAFVTWPESDFIASAARYLKPEYTFLDGSYAGDSLQLLMRRGDGETVLVFFRMEDDHLLAQTPPLPQDAFYGVENFTHSLGIGEFCLSFAYRDIPGTWMPSLISAAGQEGYLLGVHTIIPEGQNSLFYYGVHPFASLSTVPWDHLPRTAEEAFALCPAQGFAFVSNPDPADRLHLRQRPDAASPSLGKYYNNTPVKVLGAEGDFTKVLIGDTEGYMMTRYLAFDPPQPLSFSAMPRMFLKGETATTHTDPQFRHDVMGEIRTTDELLVIGLIGQDWFHIWDPLTDKTFYIRQSELFPGNG